MTASALNGLGVMNSSNQFHTQPGSSSTASRTRTSPVGRPVLPLPDRSTFCPPLGGGAPGGGLYSPTSPKSPRTLGGTFRVRRLSSSGGEERGEGEGQEERGGGDTGGGEKREDRRRQAQLLQIHRELQNVEVGEKWAFSRLTFPGFVPKCLTLSSSAAPGLLDDHLAKPPPIPTKEIQTLNSR
ncbi:UPF0329 protein [Dissostichus eleginoides]|uniref:UPF0329 protein n=1 Tax=Dissostichus eleginoides TaxID=100907 RepID=A0AAD9BVA5_DISEL|nr:UPF0329 protein [Dissostichus eleginoides]